MKIAFSAEDYNAAGNQYWEGRSLHGNPKYRYADRWLALRFALADGSLVRVARKADVKTKKGSVMRHKRRLFVALDPHPARHGPGPFDVSVLDDLVRVAVSRSFHDPVEGLEVTTAGHSESLRVCLSTKR